MTWKTKAAIKIVVTVAVVAVVAAFAHRPADSKISVIPGQDTPTTTWGLTPCPGWNPPIGVPPGRGCPPPTDPAPIPVLTTVVPTIPPPLCPPGTHWSPLVPAGCYPDTTGSTSTAPSPSSTASMPSTLAAPPPSMAPVVSSVPSRSGGTPSAPTTTHRTGHHSDGECAC